MKTIFQFVCLVIPLTGITNVLVAQWVRVLGDEESIVTCLAGNGSNLFAGIYAGGIYRSSDKGESWIESNSGLTNLSVQTLAISGTNVFAGTGTYSGSVYRSTNDGSSWTRVNSGLTDWPVNALLVSGTTLFAGQGDGFYGGSLHRSSNGGSSWAPVLSTPNSSSITALVASGTTLFAGTDLGGVFRSTDNGTSWAQANSGLTDTNITSFAVSDTNIFVGTMSGVFCSTNNGMSWTPVNTGLAEGTIVLSLSVSGTNLFRGCGGGSTSNGVFLSTDNGKSWTAVNSGLPNRGVRVLFVSGTYLFAGTWEGGLWRRPLSEVITSVQEIPGEMPRNFALQQNFPNPFNPSTTIQFSLLHSGFVTLKVFNLLGEEIAMLLSEELSAGRYSTSWNAAGIPSGVYFYQLRSGVYQDMKKLVLIK